MNAVIMAAGLGTRLKPLTDDIPKPAIEIAGKPIIRHLIDNLKKVGFDDIIVNMRYLADKLQRAIGDEPTVRYYYQKRDDYGTASVLADLDRKGLLESEFMVVNGDTLTNVNYAEMIEEHLAENNIATIFTKNDVIRSGGTYIFDREVLKYIEKNQDIPDLIQTLIDKQAPYRPYIRDYVLDNIYYLDCGTLEGLEKAKKWYAPA